MSPHLTPVWTYHLASGCPELTKDSCCTWVAGTNLLTTHSLSPGAGREVPTSLCLWGYQGPGRGEGAQLESTGEANWSTVSNPRAVWWDLNAVLQKLRSNDDYFCSQSLSKTCPEWPLSPSASFHWETLNPAPLLVFLTHHPCPAKWQKAWFLSRLPLAAAGLGHSLCICEMGIAVFFVTILLLLPINWFLCFKDIPSCPRPYEAEIKFQVNFQVPSPIIFGLCKLQRESSWFLWGTFYQLHCWS